ncbi:MAG TPA: hypothetical protein VKU87_10220 [Thermomicrobiaceae bacterium]|nr:hypothetical protein [Thermomicrobiaceae bacterium]
MRPRTIKRLIQLGVIAVAVGYAMRARRTSAPGLPARSGPAIPMGAGQQPTDEINTASDDSFPASDPPSWIPIRP